MHIGVVFSGQRPRSGALGKIMTAHDSLSDHFSIAWERSIFNQLRDGEFVDRLDARPRVCLYAAPCARVVLVYRELT